MIDPADLWHTLDALAPLELAADWDNVGLLVEPSEPRAVGRLLLAIDLTEAVLADALGWGAEAIVAYHPLIFRGLKRITAADRVGRIVAQLLAHSVALYAPHTALDACAGGMNDWLLEAAGEVQRRQVLVPCPRRPDDTTAGMGRRGRLARPLPLDATLRAIKGHLGLEHVRVAPATAHQAGVPIETLAVCPGSGGEVLAGLRGVDLLLTGEMGHHDVLARNAEGSTVVLTDHTNTERGFLPLFAARLEEALGGRVQIRICPVDRDPLRLG